jgi:hypothetical protein
MYQYSSSAKGRKGTALYAKTNDGDAEEFSGPSSGKSTGTISGEKDTAWVNAKYQVIPEDRWNQSLEIDKNPIFKALKLGMSVFKDKKPPTIDQLEDLRDSTKEFYDENIPKIKKDPVYWAYHTARTGFFVGAGNILARSGGLDLYKTDSTDPDASEKMIKGYMGYILDFFKLYEQDVESIQKGYYKQPYDLDPRNKQFNPAFVLSQL